MEDLARLLLEIKTQMDSQHAEFLNMKEEISKSINDHLDEKFSEIKDKYTGIQEQLNKQQITINYLEKHIKRRNVIFYGVEEGDRNYHDLEEKILNIINKCMNLHFDKNSIEFVGRMGKYNNKVRPTIVTLTTVGKKIELLQKAKTLKSSAYYIQEEFTKEVLEKRKELKKKVFEERKKGKNAILKYDKIIILESPINPCKNTNSNTKLGSSLETENNIKKNIWKKRKDSHQKNKNHIKIN